MTKYKDYVQKMLEDNQEVFDAFRIIHDQYSLDPNANQEEFNRNGKIVQEIIREYENRLCRNTERGMYSKFSGGLSEKFQNEVRKIFPNIDDIGIIIETPKSAPFKIKKISLHKSH